MSSQKEYPRFAAGEQVKAAGFRSPLSVLEGPNEKGQYLLSHGSMKVWLSGEQLSPSKKRQGKSLPKTDFRKSLEQEIQSLSIDLHGQNVQDALLELEKLIDRALLERVSSLEIVHGIGSGKLKNAVARYLAQSEHVSVYKLDESNPGTTWAYL